MPIDKKISEMLIDISGDLLTVVNNQREMQIHLDLVSTAWNISTNSDEKRKIELKRFMKKQKKIAPSNQALEGLEWEMQRIIKQKDRLYPDINCRVAIAEAIDKGDNNYVIRAYFVDDIGEQ